MNEENNYTEDLSKLIEMDAQLFRLLGNKNIYSKKFSYDRTQYKVRQYIQAYHSFINQYGNSLKLKELLHFYSLNFLTNRLSFAKEENEEYLFKHNRIAESQSEFKYDDGNQIVFKKIEPEESHFMSFTLPFQKNNVSGKITINNIAYLENNCELNIFFTIHCDETVTGKNLFNAFLYDKENNSTCYSFKHKGGADKVITMKANNAFDAYSSFTFYLVLGNNQKLISFQFNQAKNQITF